MEVLIALGRAGDIGTEGVIFAIKDARRSALTHPVARKWGPSQFDAQSGGKIPPIFSNYFPYVSLRAWRSTHAEQRVGNRHVYL